VFRVRRARPRTISCFHETNRRTRRRDRSRGHRAAEKRGGAHRASLLVGHATDRECLVAASAIASARAPSSCARRFPRPRGVSAGAGVARGRKSRLNLAGFAIAQLPGHRAPRSRRCQKPVVVCRVSNLPSASRRPTAWSTRSWPAGVRRRFTSSIFSPGRGRRIARRAGACVASRPADRPSGRSPREYIANSDRRAALHESDRQLRSEQPAGLSCPARPRVLPARTG